MRNANPDRHPLTEDDLYLMKKYPRLFRLPLPPHPKKGCGCAPGDCAADETAGPCGRTALAQEKPND
jgi:hypothetical protein